MFVSALTPFLASELHGPAGEFYAVQCPLRKQPSLQRRKTCPSRNADPCRAKAFKMADQIYKNWTDRQRNLWRDAATKTKSTGYNLWMESCLRNWYRGVAAPDVPNDSGGWNNEGNTIGARHFPPPCLGKAMAWAAAGVVQAPVTIIEYSPTYYEWYCDYLHDLRDIDGLEFPEVAITLSTCRDTATGKFGWTYKFISGARESHRFSGFLDAPAGEWVACARVTVHYKLREDTALIMPDEDAHLPLEPEDESLSSIDVAQKYAPELVPPSFRQVKFAGSTGTLRWWHRRLQPIGKCAAADLTVHVETRNLLTRRPAYGHLRMIGLYDPIDRVYRVDRHAKVPRDHKIRWSLKSPHYLKPVINFRWTGDGCHHAVSLHEHERHRWHQRPDVADDYDPFDVF